MKLDILTPDAATKGSVELPAQFMAKIRPDLIKRAVEAEQSWERQPYGASPEAGKRHSTFLSKRRRKYKGTYGIGQSRTPRKVMSHSGIRFNFTGAFAPQTVGGRRAHPPKAEKQWKKSINNREYNAAIRSALSATMSKDTVGLRGHHVPEKYPFALDASFEKVERTKDIKAALSKLGLDGELVRGSRKKVRAGRGTMRGRRYKKPKSTLIITAGECALTKAARNLPGVDVVTADHLTVSTLAPGTSPGRLTLLTKDAIDKISAERLYQ